MIRGFPKSGNHAVYRAVELLGLVPAVRHDLDFLTDRGDYEVAVIRDPRNIAISWLRYRNQPITPETYRRTLLSFPGPNKKLKGKPLTTLLHDYRCLLDQPIIVRYEELIAGSARFHRLAEELGCAYPDGGFDLLVAGPSMTYRPPPHADWRLVWTPEVDAAWALLGGPDLAAAFGYP